MPTTDRHTYRMRLTLVWVRLVASLLVGGIVIPQVLHSHIAAGENAAIAALINLSEAETAYRERYRDIGFAPAIGALAVSREKHCNPSPQQACMVEYGLARNEGKPFRGYYFVDLAGPETPRATFMIAAVPAQYGRTGFRSFCVIESGVPRYKDLGHEADSHQVTREQCLRDFTPLP